MMLMMKLLMLTNEDGEDFTDLVGGDMKQNKNSQKKDGNKYKKDCELLINPHIIC